MDIVKKIIYFAVGLLVLLGFIGTGIGLYNMGKKSAEQSKTELSEIMNSDRYSRYEDSTILGDELYKLTNNEDGVNIVVITGSNTGTSSAGVTYTKGAVVGSGADERKVKTSSNYINPYATFTCTKIDRSGTGVVTKLTFMQD
jgi:hypothetical protein